jgi:succinate dehydrogenase/fumarate reductase flavoprotein subunit
MGFATHLGPWLLGTVKNTTGTTAGTLRNTGCTTVAQSIAVAYTDITAGTYAFTLPAGAQILTAQFNTTVAYATTTPTYALFVNGTAINTAANGSVFTNTGVVNLLIGNNNAAAAVLCSNVGTGDAVITFTQANVTATSGAGFLTLTYVVRNSDGSQTQSAFNN